MNNLLLTVFEPFSRQANYVNSLVLYPFSHGDTQPATIFLVFIPLKLLAKVLASACDFVVNIVMLINITINKTHNIYDSV